MEWIRDFGLTLRMVLTLTLLGLVYLAFLTILASLGVNFTGLLIIAGILLFIQYYFSDKIVLLASGARLVEKDEAPELHEMVEKLAKKANLPKPKVAIMDTPIPNAFATGRSPKNAVVAVTTGLLRTLDKDEVEAVLGHELSHIKNRDVAVITISSFLATVAWFLMRWAMFAGMFGERREGGNAWFIIFLVSAIVWFISFLLIRALSRYREFAADAGSAWITRKPNALISALLKISRRIDYMGEERKKEVEGLNAFFIIPALSKESILSLFSTHPPVEKRIQRLKEIAKKMGL